MELILLNWYKDAGLSKATLILAIILLFLRSYSAEPSHCLSVSLSLDISIPPFTWQPNVPYPVMVTKVTSPWNFAIQIVNGEFDIMEKMWYGSYIIL